MVEKVLEVCKVTPSQGSSTDICLPLTFFDLVWLKIPPPELLFFYESPHSEQHFLLEILPKLKHSLSITLQHFLPIAGNLTWSSSSSRPVVHYKNGDGVLFTAAVSDVDFHHISGKNIRECRIFRPLVSPLIGSDSEVPTLAFKVALFPNKGFCICITGHHGVFNGKSMALFMKSWSCISKFGRLNGDLTPFFDRKHIRENYAELENSFEELLKRNRMAQNSLSIGEFEPPQDKVRGTFELSGLQVRKLKELLCDKVSYISTLTATYAYITMCMVKTKGVENNKVLISLPVDIRGRLDPSIPANYFGNCFGSFFSILDRNELLESDGMVVIMDCISKIIKGLDDDDGVLSWVPNYFKGINLTGTTAVSVLGLSKYGLQRLDFGWGRPKKVDNTLVDTTPAIAITTEVGYGGVEVELSLNRHEMEKFSHEFAQGLDKMTNHIFAAL